MKSSSSIVVLFVNIRSIGTLQYKLELVDLRDTSNSEMKRVGIADYTSLARQNTARNKSHIETTRQTVRVELIVFDKLVETVYERPVVENIVGIDRVIDSIMIELALVDQRQAEIVGRRAAFTNQK